MDNEQLLQTILVELKELKQGQAGLQQGQADLQQGQAGLQQGQADLQQGQAGLQQGQADLQQGQADLQQGQADLQQGQADLQQGQADLQQDVRSIKVTIEHDIRNSINLLAEGHKGLSEKLSRIDKMADDIDEIKGSMVAIDALVAKNSNSIIEIKKAQS